MEHVDMPSKLQPHEQTLHVPIPRSLREDLKAEADAADMKLREAVTEALSAWVGAKRYAREN
jgi:hypothetical protein